MTDPVEHCLIDANVLFDLIYGDILEPLFALPIKWKTSDIVLNETKPDDERLLRLGLEVVTIEGSEVAEIMRIRPQHRNLSVADLSIYILARKSNCIVVTGDASLRETGCNHGFEVHGTLWIVTAMVDQELISKRTAAKALRHMIENNRRLPRDEVEELINRWEND